MGRNGNKTENWKEKKEKRVKWNKIYCSAVKTIKHQVH